ncbi:hypothetical protein D3C85_1534520 [compost metagenome]
MGEGIALADMQPCQSAGQQGSGDCHHVDVGEGRQLRIKAIGAKKPRECRHRARGAWAAQFDFFDTWVEVRCIGPAAGQQQQGHVIACVDQRCGQAHHHFFSPAGAEVMQDNQ